MRQMAKPGNLLWSQNKVDEDVSNCNDPDNDSPTAAGLLLDQALTTIDVRAPRYFDSSGQNHTAAVAAAADDGTINRALVDTADIKGHQFKDDGTINRALVDSGAITGHQFKDGGSNVMHHLEQGDRQEAPQTQARHMQRRQQMQTKRKGRR